MAMKSVYGSLAYDLDALARERQLDDAGIITEKEAHPAPQPQRRPRPQAKSHPQPLVVGSIILLAAMVVVLMIGYVRLTAISSDVSDIKKHITELESENVSLLTEYERTYDLATVKKTAEKAGMAKPSSGQIEYIDINSGDSAVVYRAGADGAVHRAFTQIQAGADHVLEFFR